MLRSPHSPLIPAEAGNQFLPSVWEELGPRFRACEGIGFAARILLAAGYGANTGPFSSRAGAPAHGSTHYLVCCLSTDPRGGPIRRLWSATDAPPSGCWQAHA